MYYSIDIHRLYMSHIKKKLITHVFASEDKEVPVQICHSSWNICNWPPLGFLQVLLEAVVQGKPPVVSNGCENLRETARNRQKPGFSMVFGTRESWFFSSSGRTPWVASHCMKIQGWVGSMHHRIETVEWSWLYSEPAKCDPLFHSWAMFWPKCWDIKL